MASKQRKNSKNTLKEIIFSKCLIWREFNLADGGKKKFWRELNLADFIQIRQIRQIFFPPKFLPLR